MIPLAVLTGKVWMNDAVDNCNEKFIDLIWVFSEKYINGELNVKAKLVAKGFREDNSDILSNSPTCSKENMCLVLNIIPSSEWLCWAIDIKSAFLQNKNIDKVAYVKRSRLRRYYVMEIKYHYLRTQWRLKILVSQF